MPERFALVHVGDVHLDHGGLEVFSASRIATEVWVKAAGLMTMPAAVSRASWIQSMISYSRLLW